MTLLLLIIGLKQTDCSGILLWMVGRKLKNGEAYDS